MTSAPVVVDENGKQWYTWDFRAKWAYPFDPESPMFLFAAPPGGVGLASYPFLAQGEPGKPALLSTTVDFTALEPGDATPDSAQLVELTPGTETTSQVSKLVIKLHKGAAGTNGTSVLNPASFGTPVAGRMLVVNSTANGFTYAPQKAGGAYWPASVTEAGSGTTGAATLAVVSVGANVVPFAWRPRVFGSTLVTGSGPDVKVNLVARLNSATGPVVGFDAGVGGVSEKLQLVSGPDTNASLSSVTVAANAAATIYLRAEKVSGLATYSTGAVASRFCVEVDPLP